VIVVGAGLAGMRAALAAEEAGARVTLVDRGPVGLGTNSALSNGAFAGPAAPERGDEYISLVLDIGKGLNRVPYVQRVAREAPIAIEFLQSLGLDIATPPGHWCVRSPRPTVIPGVTLVRRVAERVGRCDRIQLRRGLRITAVVTSLGRAVGVRGFNVRGEDQETRAAAVVLACGGAGAIYAKHDNQATILGQGYHLAAQAGLPLWDMEFVQFYPIVLDEPGWPQMMIYPPYPAEARLIGPSGEDLLARHDLGNINQAIVRKRDAFSALLVREAQAGPVCMDLRDVPDDRWRIHPLSLLTRFKARCKQRPVRITPAVHFCMGGVRTNGEGQTDLPGLFACGEIVWGLHGANRMGGNALTECLVSGRIAGQGATEFARTHGEMAVAPEGAGNDTQASLDRGATGERLDLRSLRMRIKDAAWRYAGVLRSENDMVRGLLEAERLYDAAAVAGVTTLAERILREDLLSAAFVLRAILTASRERLESRGCFIRTDFPIQDDTCWLKNSRLSWDSVRGRFSVEYLPTELR